MTHIEQLQKIAAWFRLSTMPTRDKCAQAIDAAAAEMQRLQDRTKRVGGGFNYKDAEIPEIQGTFDTAPHGCDQVELWFVDGIKGMLYPTKIVAEQAARITFQHESADKRYGRIYYRRFTEV